MAEPISSDDELLRRFTANGDRTAFAELASRYTDLVYAAAVRQTGDASLAEDLTQGVFLLLAQKARRVPAGRLAGWLFNATRYAAANVKKMRTRRQYHESQAAVQREELVMPIEPIETDPMLGVLDTALASLGKTDREAVIQRYLQGRQIEEVSGALGINEAACRKRISRAIDKLRGFFSRNGFTSLDAGGLVALMGSAASHKAPPSLISASASAAAGASTPLIVSIAQGVSMAMTIAKVKLVVTTALAVLFVSTVGFEAGRMAFGQAGPAPMLPPPVLPKALGSVDQTSGPNLIMSLARDYQSNIWAGTEGQGIWRLDTTTNAWKQFTTRDGLGDDYGYAIACDRAGRLWVGHMNHGVSVFNGKQWQTYEPIGGLTDSKTLSGPLGERVFAIKVCPTDGDVWIATNAGLTRYSHSRDAWLYYTRAEGLPSDQVQAIAFDSTGNIYIGTQCDGIAIAQAGDDYKKWNTTGGPGRVLTESAGPGLPSCSINDILVQPDGTVIVATKAGLAYSTDKTATSWRFARGKEWAEKVRGMTGGPPPDWVEQPATEMLPEDFVTCLAQDDQGKLWAGFRKEGVANLQIQSGKQVHTVSQTTLTTYVTCLLANPDGVMVGAYGNPSILPHAKTAAVPAPPIAALPKGASAPSEAEIEKMLADLNAVPRTTDQTQPFVASLADDWRTRGEWLGRYGRYWIALNGYIADMPYNAYIWGAGPVPIFMAKRQGPHREAGDGARFYTGASYTSDPRALEFPQLFLEARIKQNQTTEDRNRRQSEFGDNGTSYPPTQEGPDLFENLNVPQGVFYLTLYSVNENGQRGNNRYRDYTISIRQAPNPMNLQDIEKFDEQPELARARMRDFWPGVYKRFLVKGPVMLAARATRDYSFNTKLSAESLDLVDALPEPYYAAAQASASAPADAADRLADAMDKLLHADPQAAAPGMEVRNILLARWYQQRMAQLNDRAAATRLMNCLYHLHCFEPLEQLQARVGIESIRKIEKSLKWDGVSNMTGKGREAILSVRRPTTAPAN